MNLVKTGEIEVAAIHYIKCTRFEDQSVENVDIVNSAVSNDNNGRNAAPQVEQSMEFYGTFRPAKPGPGEKRKTQIDGRRIECVSCVVEFDAKTRVRVKRPRHPNQDLSKVSIYAPVADGIRVGQSVARNPAPDAHVIKFRVSGPQTGLYVSKTFAICKLCKSHAEKLIQA